MKFECDHVKISVFCFCFASQELYTRPLNCWPLYCVSTTIHPFCLTLKFKYKHTFSFIYHNIISYRVIHSQTIILRSFETVVLSVRGRMILAFNIRFICFPTGLYANEAFLMCTFSNCWYWSIGTFAWPNTHKCDIYFFLFEFIEATPNARDYFETGTSHQHIRNKVVSDCMEILE